jgi:hypothetical protein
MASFAHDTSGPWRPGNKGKDDAQASLRKQDRTSDLPYGLLDASGAAAGPTTAAISSDTPGAFCKPWGPTLC